MSASALKKEFRKYPQWAGSRPLLIEYELITFKLVSKMSKNDNLTINKSFLKMIIFKNNFAYRFIQILKCNLKHLDIGFAIFAMSLCQPIV